MTGQYQHYQRASAYGAASRRPKPLILLAVAALHIALFYGLAMALVPNVVAEAPRAILSAVNLEPPPPPVAEPPPPPPPPPPRSKAADEGAQGAPGKAAEAKAETAPKPKIPIAKPDPKPETAGRGKDNSSGAAESGKGTGADGQGQGTGSGNRGTGSGAGIGPGRGVGVAVTKLTKIAGNIDTARDFPTPPGGRNSRLGKSVIVNLAVGTNGRVSSCRIVNSQVDAEAANIVCRLATQRFRFEPRRDANGNALPGVFQWKQDWHY